MTDLLTVHRHRPDGTHTVHRLSLQGGRYLVTTEGSPDAVDQTRILTGVTSASQALRCSRSLHLARFEDQTDFVCPTPRVLSAQAVRQMIRADEPTSIGHNSNARDDIEMNPMEWTIFDEVDTVWSTRHQITLDGVLVYAIPGQNVVVQANDYHRPYDSWPDLVTFSWDSSEYAAVGMAGYGTSGLYRPHPILVATVEATDEMLDISFDRISARVSDSTLIEHRLGCGVFSDRLWPQLVLLAHGYRATDLYPGDEVTCSLPPARLRRLAHQWLREEA